MSKAFTRESDDAPERPEFVRPSSALPPGAKNYITPKGAERMRQELSALTEQHTRMPARGSQESPSETKRRIRQLQSSLATAVITPAPPPPWLEVRFGATVKVRDETGDETSYRIVGVDEADVDRDWASWLSPIACALLNARVGEKVRFKFPAGVAQLEIRSITYE